MAGPSADIATATEQVRIYKEAAKVAGRTPEVIMMKDAWVASSRAEAERVYGPEVMTAYGYYWRNQNPNFSNLGSDPEFTLENLARDRLILGDPEECVSEFRRWSQATGTDYFLLRLRHAHSSGPPHEKIMECIRLLGEQVIPYCQ